MLVELRDSTANKLLKDSADQDGASNPTPTHGSKVAERVEAQNNGMVDVVTEQGRNGFVSPKVRGIFMRALLDEGVRAGVVRYGRRYNVRKTVGNDTTMGAATYEAQEVALCCTMHRSMCMRQAC